MGDNHITYLNFKSEVKSKKLLNTLYFYIYFYIYYIIIISKNLLLLLLLLLLINIYVHYVYLLYKDRVIGLYHH